MWEWFPMKRALWCAIIPVVLGASGCTLTDGQIDETTRAQVESLLREAETHMHNAAQLRGIVLRFNPELGPAAERLEEGARRDVQLALDKCYEAYYLEPAWAPSNHGIAVCELALGNNDMAIKFARRTLDLDGERPEAWVIIGAAHAEKALQAQDVSTMESEYRKAVAAYQTFINKRPLHMGVPSIQTTIAVIREELEKLH